MTAKAEEAAKRGGKAQDLVVVSPLKSWTCAECAGTGDFLTMDDAGPLCLSCADLDHLVYLAAGDAALTRRAKKASSLSAVVVRFSRTGAPSGRRRAPSAGGEEILRLYPSCPRNRAEEIARHAFIRGSGRVGRTAAGRDLEPEALNLAVAAAVRHVDTPYDELLMAGMDRLEARAHVQAEVERVMSGWQEQATAAR